MKPTKTLLSAKRSMGRTASGFATMALLTLGACEDHDEFSSYEWQVVETLRPFATPMIKNPANALADNLDAARLGQMIWFDPDFSSAIKAAGPTGNVGDAGKVACVTCHDPKQSFVDTRTPNFVSHGTGFTGRNSPALVNLGWYEWFTWGGRMDSLAMQGANAPEAPTDVASTRLFFAHILYKKYAAEYNLLFPAAVLDPRLDPAHELAAQLPPVGKPKVPGAADGPWEGMQPADQKIINGIMANVGKTFEAYERRLVSAGSPFEKYVNGDNGALSLKAKRGLRLFMGKAACNDCHTGPILTDNKFHNVAVAQVGTDTPIPAMDTGRFGEFNVALTNPFRSEGEWSDDKAHGAAKLKELVEMKAAMQTEQLRGVFRTPALLNIADTGPYFHNGSAKSLLEVVRHYNRGGAQDGTFAGVRDPKMRPLSLTAEEETDLVAFLEHLTGGPVPDEWAANTAKPTVIVPAMMP